MRTITADVAGDNFGVDATDAGDVDGDGLTDFLITSVGLAFAGLDTGRAYLLAGTVLPCVSDLDADGQVGPPDLILLNQQIGAGDGPADLNGDGVVDRLDRDVLLRDFGPCPSL